VIRTLTLPTAANLPHMATPVRRQRLNQDHGPFIGH